MRFTLSLKPTLLWGMLLTLPLGATQFVPLSIEEISSKSDLIVHGTVESKTCARDDSGRIFTKVSLRVSETWKGAATTHLDIIQSGGILGEEAALVPGQANYDIGEEVVAFLVLNARREAVTLGLAHGKFHVSTNARTGEKLAHNIFHGKLIGENKFQGSAAPSALTIAELKRRALGTKP